MTTTTKVYIGIGVVAVAGLAYYFATKKPTATLVESKPSSDAKPDTTSSVAKKELTQAEADAIVSKIVDQRKREMLIKVTQGYVSPIVAWVKELKDGGYVFSNNKAVKQTASNKIQAPAGNMIADIVGGIGITTIKNTK